MAESLGKGRAVGFFAYTDSLAFEAHDAGRQVAPAGGRSSPGEAGTVLAAHEANHQANAYNTATSTMIHLSPRCRSPLALSQHSRIFHHGRILGKLDARRFELAASRAH